MSSQAQYYMENPNCYGSSSFKNKFFKHFSKKNERHHCNDNFQNFFEQIGSKFEQIGKSIESRSGQIGKSIESKSSQVGKSIESRSARIGNSIESKSDQFGKSIESKFDQIGKKIESKVEEWKVKAQEKANCQKHNLKRFIFKKIAEALIDNDNHRAAPVVNREEIKIDNVEAVSQAIHYPQYAPEQQVVGSDMGPTVTCQYCNDNILVSFMEEHASSCIYGSDMIRCGDCGGYYKTIEAQNHFQDCQGNIENINIQCEQCNNMVAMKSYFYHLSICGSQAINHEELPQIPAREISECAICLLEINRDGSGKFLECAHHFHGDCIDDWAKRQKACPICMHEF